VCSRCGRVRRRASTRGLTVSEPQSGSYPVAGSAGGGSGGPMTGAIRSLM
jgi:hypothetical protein